MNHCREPLRAICQVRAELYKLSSLSLCSNTVGQLATGLMINPPKKGEPSYEKFQQVQWCKNNIAQCCTHCTVLYDMANRRHEVLSCRQSTADCQWRVFRGYKYSTIYSSSRYWYFEVYTVLLGSNSTSTVIDIATGCRAALPQLTVVCLLNRPCWPCAIEFVDLHPLFSFGLFL